MFGFAGREGGWAGLGCIFLLGWAGLGWAVGWWPGLGAGGRGLDLLGLGLGLEVLGPDWGAGAGAGLEGAGYPDVVGLCSTRNPMGLKHLLGGFWELSREGVRFGGSQRCLICAFNNHGTWSMSGARLRLLTQDFTRSLTGEEVGGGGGREIGSVQKLQIPISSSRISRRINEIMRERL